MNDHACDILNDDPLCREILAAYADSEQSGESVDQSEWRNRVADQSDDQDPQDERWSNAHGTLIAFGLLDIELVDRSVGMRYRITTDGKKALAKTAQPSAA